MFSFITEIVGLSAERFEEYRNAQGAYDVLPIVAATLPREADALTHVDLPGLAVDVATPVLLLLGTVSPRWAGEITRALAARLTTVELVTIPDHGHDAIDMAPDLIIDELCRFLDKD